jgi:geranylgeranylglycerol-phosphate geranylgeranyltransferase
MSKAGSKKSEESIGKLTIKEPYTKTRFLSKQARGVIDLFRAFTLYPPLVVSMAIMTASLVYNYNYQNIPAEWWITVGQASFTITVVNAASNALNQATDVEADKISKPYRPIPKGVVKAEGAQSLAYLLYLFALLRAVTINVWFGIFIFLIMIFTVTYSLPPRMKKYLILNQIWIAIPRGMIGILASWSVFGDPFTPTPLIIGAIATTYLIGGMAAKDIVDAEADKKTGTHTMINTFGCKKTALMVLPFMIFPFAFIPIFIDYNLLEAYLIPLTLLIIPGLFVAYLIYIGTESKTLENVQAWAIMYILYIIFAMAFSLMVIFRDILPWYSGAI